LDGLCGALLTAFAAHHRDFAALFGRTLWRSVDGLCGAQPFNGVPQNFNKITPHCWWILRRSIGSFFLRRFLDGFCGV